MREGGPADRVRDDLSAQGRRVAVVVARFNREITDELLAGARTCLADHGAAEGDVTVYRVPGAWELPQAAARLVEANRFDAVVALGCVIRGETPHFDYICGEAARGLGAVARRSPIPVTFGVLTTDTEEQARVRADRSDLDKGREAALAALEMMDVFSEIRSPAQREP